MKWSNRLFDFYLDASIHVALGVFALLKVTGILLHISVDSHLAYYLFFGTIACYNFIKYGVEAEKYLMVANRYHKNIQFFSFAALAVALYHLYFLTWETWCAIGVVSFLTAVYALPVLPHAKNVRSMGLLKIMLVGLVWAGSTVVFPVLEASESLKWDTWIETCQRFLLVLVLLVPFEIRDLKYDDRNLRTLPQRVGTVNTKRWGALWTVLLFLLTFLKDHISLDDVIGKGVLCLGLGGILLLTKRDQGKYFASFWVEAIPLVWWFVLLILQSYL